MEWRPPPARWALFASGLLLAAVSARAQTGVSDDRVSLPDGPGSLDGIGDNASVNPNMGLFSTSIPISVPQGFPDATPSFALSYSSGAGSSVVGIGWSMPVPSVERMTAKGLPIYDDTDHFVVDGSDELVLVSDAEPQVFRTRFEGGFVRWTWHDRGLGDEGWWKAEYPDGNTAYFGADPDGTAVETARLRSPDGIFRWLQTTQVDRFGHEVKWSYQVYGAVPLLDTVGWAFDAQGVARYEVQLDYEARTDLISDCKGGFNELLGHRLSTIHVLVAGTQLRSYELTYEPYNESGGYSRLQKVERFGKDGGLYPLVSSFEYSRALGGVCDGIVCEAPYLVDMGAIGVALGAKQANLIDINGDSLPDVVDTVDLSANSKVRIHLNVLNDDGTQSFAPATSSAVGDASGFALDSPRVQMLDYNGDGFSDILNTASGRVLVNLGGGDFASDSSISGGTGNLPDFSTDFTLDTDGELAHVRFLDYDLDRKIDVIQSDISSTQIFKNLGTGGFVAATGVDPIEAAFADGRLEMADMNGDGLLDPVKIADGLLSYRLNLGFGKWTDWVDITGLGFSGGELDFLELEDMNGDGIEDVVVVSPGLVRYALNRNGEFFDAVASIATAGGTALPARDTTTTVLFADMNGNGSNDVVWIDAGGNVTFLELFPVRPNLLSRVENGLGMVTDVSYGSAAEQRALVDGLGWDDPMPNATLVVESTDTYAQAANVADEVHELTSYTYSAGFYDGAEKRFAGFQHVVETRAGDTGQEAAIVTRDYDTGDGVDRAHFRGLLLSETTAGSAGPLDTVARAWELCPLSDVPATTPPVRWACNRSEATTTQEARPQSDWVETRIEFEYDGYGNTTKTSKLGRVDTTGDEEYEETTYVAPTSTGGLWLLNAVATSRSYTSPGGRVAETRTYYDGAPFVGLALGNLTLGLATRVESDVDATTAVDEERSRYNGDGMLVETINPNGAVSGTTHRLGLTYDALGFHIAEQTRTLSDAQGDYALRRAYTYDPLHDAVASSTRWFVDGAPPSEDDRTLYGYDEHGRISYTVKPGGDTTSNPTEKYTYTMTAPLSRLVVMGKTEPGSTTFDLEEIRCMDGFGRIVQQRHKLGAGSYEVDGTKVFNRRGQTQKVYQPYSATTGDCGAPPAGVLSVDYTYDAAGREILAVEPDAALYGSASTRATVYEPLRITRYDEEDGDSASAHYDTPFIVDQDGLFRPIRAERRLSTTQSDSLVYTFGYDDLGELATLTDPEGNVKTQTRDLLGRVITIDDPDMGATTNEYDAAGNLVASTDARGVTVRRAYDAMNRQIAEWDDADAAGTKIEKFYDRHQGCPTGYCQNGAANVVATQYPVLDGAGLDYNGFDARGRIVKSQRTLHGKVFEMTSGYDGADRLVSQGYPGGRTITMVRDGADRVVSIPGYIPVVEYNPQGLVSHFEYENGVATDRTFDVRMRLNGITAKKGGDDVLGLAFTRDRNGDITAIDDAVGTGSTSLTADFVYDAAQRLTSAVLDDQTLTMRYGRLDEILEKSSSVAASAFHVGDIAYDGDHPRAATDAGGLALAYDEAGVLTSRGDVDLTIDHLGRIAKVDAAGGTTGRYAYGPEPDDRLLSIEGGAQTWSVAPGFEVRDGVSRIQIGLGDVVMVELETTDLTADLLSDIVPDDVINAGDAFVATVDGTAETTDPSTLLRASARRLLLEDGAAVTYRHTDQLESTVAVTDESGAVVERIAYFPFGEVRGASAVNTEMVSFSGKEIDDATGFYYFGARHYDAHLGRFTAPDPEFKVLEGDPTETLLDLVMGYAYVGNDPTTRIDQDGRKWGVPGLGGLVKAGVIIGIGAAVGVLSFGAANIVGAVAGGVVGAFTGIAKVITQGQDADREGRPGKSALAALGTIFGSIVSGAAEGLVTGGVSAIVNAASMGGEIAVRAASSDANVKRNVERYKIATAIGGIAAGGLTLGLQGLAKVLPSVPATSASLGNQGLNLAVKGGKALVGKVKEYRAKKAAAKAAKPNPLKRANAQKNLKGAAKGPSK